MKKLFKILLVIIALVGIYFYLKGDGIDSKKDWYVKITNDFINVRANANTSAKKIGRVNKGKRYRVKSVYTENSIYYWYEIYYDKEELGWIASDIKNPYLEDHNNPHDIYSPTIKIKYMPYKAKDIKSIGFENLEVWDDKDNPKITYVVYHEVDATKKIDQYWIKYTVTDSVGNTASKIGSITFETKPSKNEVEDFKNMKK